MTRIVLRRLVTAIPLLLGITVVTFAILRAVPGGPLAAYEADPNVSPADLARLEHAFGLDEPLPLQYLTWLSQLFTGDWGSSITSSQPVRAMIGERLPNTLTLMGIVYVVTLAVALPLGVLTATRHRSRFDHLVSGISFVAYAVPPFWLGLLLILGFGLGLRWLPLGGMTAPDAAAFDLADRLRHLVLPVTTLALFGAAHYVRYLRAAMLETLGADYLRTARAKGLPERTVVLRHALPHAAIPLVTVAALDLPELFAGALVTEQLFGWPGMGRLFWDAATRSDYPVLMGILAVSALLVVAASLVADLVYAWLDPRIRIS